MTNTPLSVSPEATPNPHSYKFKFNQVIANEAFNFDDPLKSSRSPLAHKIFGFPWVESVYIGTDFVTINKQDWVEWDMIAEPLSNLLKEHIEDGQPVFASDSPAPDSASNEFTPGKHPEDPNDSELVKKIKQFLDQEIRPFVAMDGGDVSFNKFEDGVLTINMTGACNGCPSSTQTLKVGIEGRIKEIIPDVQEVVSA